MSSEHIIIVAAHVGMAEFERQLNLYVDAFGVGKVINGKRVVRVDIRRSAEEDGKPIDAEIWLGDE